MTRPAYLMAPAMFALALAAGTASAIAAESADDGFTAGSVLVRVRGLAVLPDLGSTVTPIGGAIHVTDAYVPEIDFSYFFTPNIAAELIAATTRHSVSDTNITALGGANSALGTVYLLPPTLTLQWHFFPNGAVNPYIGGGVNYTIFYNATNGSQHNGISYDNNFGGALQAGVDIPISGRWYLNADVKKIFLSTTARVNALKAVPTTAKVDIDPLLVGVGIGYRF